MSGAGSADEAARWQLRETRLDELLALSAAEREARLARLARAEPGEAQALRTWLDDMERSAGFLDAPPAAPGRQHQAGDRVGLWQLERPLGRGGMGEVWLATRADGAFDKHAAIKFLRSDSRASGAQLAHERQVLARLEHPVIARLLDGGLDAAGAAYLVTEYVDGIALDAWCAARTPDLATRLALFRDIAAAVSYAHANLIVHRDIKPANVLVDASGHARLLDFGIAKLIDPAMSGDTVDHPLTPPFAAPEQVTGAPITTATDVYALGALLYLLLTGVAPLDTRGLALGALARRICEDQPVAPSLRGIIVAASAPLRADLDAIVLKALAKAPAGRYANVAALIADLDNALALRPVAARRPNRAYRLRRYLRRNRGPLGVAALLLAVLLAGFAGTLWQARVATVQRNRAELERDSAEREAVRGKAIVDYLLALLGNAAPNGEAVRVQDLLAKTGDRVLADAQIEPGVRAALVGVLADIYAQRRDYAGSERLLQPLLADAGRLPDDVVARAACDLATAERNLGKRDAAHRWLDIGLAHAQSERTRGLHAACLSEQALLAELDGEIERALSLHRQALAEIDPHGSESSDLASTLHGNYAATLTEADRLAEARAEYDRALAILRRLGRGATADAASLLAGVAMQDRYLGLLLPADAEMTQANALRFEVSGPSAGLAQQLINAAGWKIELGQAEAALRLLDRAEAMQKDFVSPGSMHYAQLALQRGRALGALGKRDEARAEFARTRQLFAKLVPATSRFYITLDQDEAELLLETGAAAADARRALPLLARVEAAARAGGKSGLLQLPKILLDEAEAAARAGEFDLAAAKATDARERYVADADADSWQIAACDIVLARVDAAHGDSENARKRIATAIPHLKRALGAQHPRTLMASALLPAIAATSDH